MEVERAVALSPDSALGYVALGQVSIAEWKPAETLAAADKAIRLDPSISNQYSLCHRGIAYSQLGRWEEAILILKRHLVSNADDFWAHVWLAVDYIEVGRDDAARAEAAEALRLNPRLSAEMLFPPGGVPQKTHPEEIGRFRADLRKAGLK
jgi:tetratricopeptide (TPR) repeat protein